MAYQILLGDVLERLRELPDCSVQCCVTSPPYWGLRDYGVEGQIGLEASPDEHVAKLVEVFREVRRVLRDDGVLWCNYGDAHMAAQGGRQSAAGLLPTTSKRTTSSPWNGQRGNTDKVISARRSDLKPKDLIGLPWMLAFALRADGWWLRSDIVWHKPNPMPESVTDRPTRAHEYVFLLSKAARYYYDAEAIRDMALQPEGRPRLTAQHKQAALEQNQTGTLGTNCGASTRNARTVWTINPQPTPEAHFATFPEALAERCIKAGTSQHGACPKCGAPWERVVESTYDRQGRTTNGPRSTERRHETAGFDVRAVKISNTVGWFPTCDCGAIAGTHAQPYAARPCVVIDPFAGSGTTLLVAERLGRDSIGIELNPAYVEIAKQRISRADPMAPLTLPNGKVQPSLFAP